jgi:homoserine O-acetyltransferase/O-succinyltransferase
MRLTRRWRATLAALLCGAAPLAVLAADYPAPVERDWIARDFRFHSGEVMPELRLHVTTIGAPTGEPVLILHGTAGSAAGLLVPAFAGELFGPGQALDASRYFIIIPDAIGTGKSARPSDGLRTRFPHYNYDDMVEAQYRLVTEGLGVRHLRLVLGNSMGGMHTWLWGTQHPGFMDALVPMACQPTEMSGRNWMMRRLLVESIKADPGWMGGIYSAQPRSLALAVAYFGIATSGGTQAYYQAAPTRALADKVVDARIAAPFAADANDTIYQWESSSDYNASPGLERIEATLLAINSADDERNPPELKIMEREMARVKRGRFLMIPASAETRGHGTTGLAKFWVEPVKALLQEAPRRPTL